MKYYTSPDLCPICGGRKIRGKTLFSIDLGSSVVVVRNVPALICELCGEEWIDNKTAQELEDIAEEAKHKHHQVEILAFA